MKIWIDAKNPALHSGGISAWLKDLLEGLEPDLLSKIVLVYPRIKGIVIYPDLKVSRLELPWFSWLPKKIARVLYDNWVFKLFASLNKPDCIFSPYFDFAVPRGIPTYITIHDLCFFDVPQLYPNMQRRYYVHMLKQGIAKAQGVITVSNSTKDQLMGRFGIPATSIHVVRNRIDTSFLDFVPTLGDIHVFNKNFSDNSIKILYTSGFENRKNLPNLLKGFRILLNENKNYSLLITGKDKTRWLELLAGDEFILKKIVFLGYLTQNQLKTAYTASDAVVYPSFSEGFGRACIEAMSVGTPLACSNLNVFHEVGGDYPIFFDPMNPIDVARAIAIAAQTGKKIPDLTHTHKHENDLVNFKKILFDYSGK